MDYAGVCLSLNISIKIMASLNIRLYFKHYIKQFNTGLATEYGKIHVFTVERGSPRKTTEMKEGGKESHNGYQIIPSIRKYRLIVESLHILLQRINFKLFELA